MYIYIQNYQYIMMCLYDQNDGEIAVTKGRGWKPVGSQQMELQSHDGDAVGEVVFLVSLALIYLPSGKSLHNYWKSPCLMDKSTINGYFP